MENNDYSIRLEREDEHFLVENLIREAFWNVYRPGCLEHYVMHCLRNDPDFIPELDFVLEKDGQIIGQAMCMRASISLDNGKSLPIMTLGPIGIAPQFKRKGYGKAILDYTLEKAAELGYGAVCFEGNIDFYGKSGFRFASEYGVRYHGLPEGEDSSFFLCKELKKGYLDGVSGEYSTPEGYFVDEAKADEFDSQFPKKEKMTLPGQLW